MLISGLSGYFDGYNWFQGIISVEIQNGKITSIIQSDDKGDLHLPGQFLSVPFVDGHTHLIFAGDRSFELPLKIAGKSYAEILESGGGILNTVKATRKASNDELKDLVERRIEIMMKHGTLMVEAKSGYGLTIEQEIRQLEVLKQCNSTSNVEIVSTFCGAHAIPHDNPRETYIEEIIDVLPEIKKKDLATSNDVFCDRGAYTVEETCKIQDKCLEIDFPIRVHADELAYTGIGKISAEKYNALSADHLLLSNEQDFQALEKYSTTAMFMPAATIGLFTTQTPQGWQKSSVNIGLGSDFNPNNMVYSMQTAIRLAVYLYKMDPLHAFKAATSGSYKGITGKPLPKLQEGSDADFIIVNAKSIPEFTTRFDQNMVSYVYKGGSELFQNDMHNNPL